MTPLEVVGSWLPGFECVQDVDHGGMSPRVAIERLILAHSDRPVFVAFSGGRDSSAILAIAAEVARRHGLAAPVPLTEVFPGDEASSETQWQETVVRHLGLTSWSRLRIGDDGDLLGPAARASLRQHGLLWPAALHVKSQLLEAASGGVLLTGEGGDEVLGATRNGPVRELLLEHRWVGRPHAGAVAESVSPRRVRQEIAYRRLLRDDLQPWLRPAAKEQHLRQVAHDLASEPFSRGEGIKWTARRRAAVVAGLNRRRHAAHHDVVVLDPLLDRHVVSALAARAGLWGWRGRTTALQGLVGDLLPDAILDRRSKALFNTAYFGPASREFASAWDGSGLDPELVDAEALRSEWLSATPSALSFLPMQAAWHAARSSWDLG